MDDLSQPKSLQVFLERVTNEEETRSYMQELARLYDIVYGDIMAVLKKCLDRDNKQDMKLLVQQQRNRLRLIMKHLSKDKDPFVSCMKKANFLKQYINELGALEQMMNVTYRLQKNKTNIQQRLGQRVYSAIHLDRVTNRSQYSLKKQIQNSTKRCLRIKSGAQLRTVCSGQLKNTFNDDNTYTFEQMMLSFKTKHKELQTLLREFISRPNRCQVTFERKYDDLAGYFQKRLEFTNFYLGENYIRQIKKQMAPQVSEQAERPIEASPFLTEFNIKTKNIKPAIKKKIDEAIRQVKMRLIDQFHINRTNKFKEINTEEQIELVRPRWLKSSPRCETSGSLVRQVNKWTRETGRTSSTRVSTANGGRAMRYYKKNIPGPELEVDDRLLQRLKRSTYR